MSFNEIQQTTDVPRSAVSRRAFVAASGVAAVCGALGLSGCELSDVSTAEFVSPEFEPSSKTVLIADVEYQADQYGFMAVPDLCRGCGACVEACRTFNRLPADVENRRHITSVPRVQGKLNISTACMHCAEPSCAKNCPAGAISKGAGGVVVVDHSRCIGCRYCKQTCPYDVPTYTTYGMDKCDCCFGTGLPLGEVVPCVAACPFQALYFGTMSRLFEISTAIKRPIAPLATPNTPSCVVA